MKNRYAMLALPTPLEIENEDFLESSTEAQKYLDEKVIPRLKDIPREGSVVIDLRWAAWTIPSLQRAGWDVRWNTRGSERGYRIQRKALLSDIRSFKLERKDVPEFLYFTLGIINLGLNAVAAFTCSNPVGTFAYMVIAAANVIVGMLTLFGVMDRNWLRKHNL